MLKGTTQSEESKQKISLSKKGSIPWNKGVRTGLTSEKQRQTAQKNWLGDKNPIHNRDISGENHPNWISDRDKLVKDEKKHLDGRYREWMKAVKGRDSWNCSISNSDCDGRLEAHHILNWVDYPELRYEVNNGITLCLVHHPRGRTEEKRLVSEFQDLVSVSS